MCKVLGVSRSGYYKWLKNKSEKPTKTEQRRQILKQLISKFFHQSLGTYGAPRIHKDLLADGYKVDERTVGRYMKDMGLRANPKTPYTATTDSDHSLPVFENLLRQNFDVERPNQVWVSDITYVWTTNGWLYLAIVLDLFSRKIVGWQMADHMRTELPLDALRMAILAREPEPGLVHHSDRGSQYASKDYRAALSSIEAIGSMSRTGNPYDNACAETFFATLKKEFAYRRQFKTKEEAKEGVHWYISQFYNERRRHSKNGYLSPNQFERGDIEDKCESLDSCLLAG